MSSPGCGAAGFGFGRAGALAGTLAESGVTAPAAGTVEGATALALAVATADGCCTPAVAAAGAGGVTSVDAGGGCAASTVADGWASWGGSTWSAGTTAGVAAEGS